MKNTGEHGDIPDEKENQQPAAEYQQTGDGMQFGQQLFGQRNIPQPVKMQKKVGHHQKDTQGEEKLVMLEGIKDLSVQQCVYKMGAAAAHAFSAQQQPGAGGIFGKHIAAEPPEKKQAGNQQQISGQEKRFLMF